ncbi:MAG TPA: tetratricopeptide repeat protein, partial [Dehalococcoidia bacterium]|nr:tetratricopeptide repeat protein [Dehalococcoidia bacterium]
ASLPYSAVSRLLESAAGGDLESTRLAPFAAELAILAPGMVKLVPGDVPKQAPGDISPDWDRRRALDTLARCVRALCEEQPTVLAFDDLHWADASSLEAILRLAREAAPGCMLLLTYRDDERTASLDSLLAALDRERLGAEVSLRRLTLDEVDRMLKATLGSERSTRADILHVIHRLTGGNPFFVEEVLRSILDAAGSIEGLDALRLTEIDVPRGVHEAMRRRSRDLSADAKQVLSLAAVAGARFELSLLQELLGRSEQSLVALLKELVAAQLVVEETPNAFAFRHALTREAVRSQLLHHERRLLSKQIAETLERAREGDADLRLSDLAMHYYEAEDWEKAFEYSRRSGERAMALYAPAEALAHLTRAIHCADRLGGIDCSEVYRLRGAAHEAVGELEAARLDYEEAAIRAEAAGNSRVRWRVLLNLGLLWASRDYAKSEPYYREALELARALGEPAAIAHSLNRLGNWHSNVGDADRALELSEEALAIFRANGDLLGTAQTLDLLGMTCVQAMRFGAALSYYREAIALLERLDDKTTLASALASIQIGAGTYQTDMVAPALSLAEGAAFGERALTLARQMGAKSAESYALWQLAFSLGPQGEYARALECAEEAVRIAREIGHVQWEIAAECSFGAVLTDILATDMSQVHLRRALQLAREMASNGWIAQATALLVEALVAGRDVESAIDLYMPGAPEQPGAFGTRQLYAAGAEAVLASGDPSRALAMAKALEAATEVPGPGQPVARLRRLQGRALMAIGQPEEAIALLAEAAKAARAHGQLSHAWRADAELAQALLLSGRREAAKEAGTNAIALLDSLAVKIPAGRLRDGFLEKAMQHLPAALRRRPQDLAAGPLTGREAEVAALVARGLTNRRIAEILVLSSRTVETHVANAMAKLGLDSRSQLAAWAVEHGLQAPPL